MTQLRLNYQYATDFVAEAELEYLAPSINLAHEQLHGRATRKRVLGMARSAS